MKPNFALSLSSDGIRLLLRASGGWRLVGEVSATSSDLAGQLGVLRKTASELQPGRVRTKLIIPDDQIRFLSIETGPLDRDSRIEAARAALNGATPYPVDALAFGVSEDGGKTHIAAVARETLAEAEAFASEHRFHPVSFVAAPTNKPFLGEPFFGPTAYASTLLEEGESIEADGVRVVVIGKLDVPTGPVAKDDEPALLSATDRLREAASETTEHAHSSALLVSNPPAESLPDPSEKPSFARSFRLKEPTPESVVRHQKRPDVSGASTIPRRSSAHSDAVPVSGFSSRRGAGKPKVETPKAVKELPRQEPIGTRPAMAAQVALELEFSQAVAESLNPDMGPEVSLQPLPEPPRIKDDSISEAVAFLSRRKPLSDEAKRFSAPPSANHMTAAAVARELTAASAAPTVTETWESPRSTTFILAILLVLLLAGVAAWASLYFGERLSSLFPGRERTLASTLPDDASKSFVADVGATISMPPPEPDTDETFASLTDDNASGLIAEDAAVLDALRADPLPVLPLAQDLSATSQEELPETLSTDAQQALYAVTGVWTISPAAPETPPMILLEDLYVTGIDPVSPALDAVALPSAEGFRNDVPIAAVASPAELGTSFNRDRAGRVVPTIEGALSPDGFTVYLGQPPIVPPTTPQRTEDTPAVGADLIGRTLVRPRARPSDLVEQFERATLGGLSRTELAAFRPRLRPAAPQEIAARAAAITGAPQSALAVKQSLRPNARPRNFQKIVARASPSPKPAVSIASTARTQTASVAPRTVKPKFPSATSVTREATVKNAINLRRVNLIGVYGSPSNRRALVRLGSGRYQKVQVGDRFDGGRVLAIGDSELRYQKGGRNVVLKIPKG